MYPLFETIAIKEGQVQNIALHQQRYERSLRQFYGQNIAKVFNLSELICLPTNLTSSLIRCRIDYNHSDYQIQYSPYQRKIYRRFKPVICDHIDYSLKYANRQLLGQLLQQKGDFDEIMIVKQGKITDCTIGNLVFRRNQQWFTPDSPLLAGVMREYLLNQKKITAIPIKLEDMAQFDEIRLINALNGLIE